LSTAGEAACVAAMDCSTPRMNWRPKTIAVRCRHVCVRSESENKGSLAGMLKMSRLRSLSMGQTQLYAVHAPHRTLRTAHIGIKFGFCSAVEMGDHVTEAVPRLHNNTT
jgi:hypothetical protein